MNNPIYVAVLIGDYEALIPTIRFNSKEEGIEQISFILGKGKSGGEFKRSVHSWRADFHHYYANANGKIYYEGESIPDKATIDKNKAIIKFFFPNQELENCRNNYNVELMKCYSEEEIEDLELHGSR